MSNLDQEIRTIVDELLKAISTKNVISEPIEVGDNVMITITKVGLGFGAGTGEGKAAERGGASGGGVGGVAGVSPVAVLVIHKSISGPGGVEVKSLAPPNAFGKAVSDIASTLVEKISSKKEKNEDKADDKENKEEDKEDNQP
jgi:uncharacterized spore protein YtfJ